jgi:hypothetical protein
MTRIVHRLAAIAIMTAWWLAVATTAFAQSPSASPVGGDPRSPGEGPGLVGDPVLAIGGVVVIALITVGGTLAYVHFTGGPGSADGGRGRDRASTNRR